MNPIDEIMIEFGSMTHPKYPPTESTDIVEWYDENLLSADEFEEMWNLFRRTDEVVEKYGPATSAAVRSLSDEKFEWYSKNIAPIFAKFIRNDTGEGPYYLCICRESGDECLIRRSILHDKFTKGKFLFLKCRYSEMSDCDPRNKLKNVRMEKGIDGEFILFFPHVAGTIEERDRVREQLEIMREGKNIN
jgi:hypothetical protein